MRGEHNKNALEVSFAVRLAHQKRDAVDAITEELQSLALMNPSLIVSRIWSQSRHGWLYGIRDTKRLCSNIQFLLFEGVLNDPHYCKQIIAYTSSNYKYELDRRGYIT